MRGAEQLACHQVDKKRAVLGRSWKARRAPGVTQAKQGVLRDMSVLVCTERLQRRVQMGPSRGVQAQASPALSGRFTTHQAL